MHEVSYKSYKPIYLSLYLLIYFIIQMFPRITGGLMHKDFSNCIHSNDAGEIFMKQFVN